MNKKKPYIEVFIYKYPSEYRAVNYRHWGGKVRFWDGVDWWTSIGGSYNRATDAIRGAKRMAHRLGVPGRKSVPIVVIKDTRRATPAHVE